MFALLFISFYFFTTFNERNNYYIFCIMPALAFLLMHTTLFAWGTFPFIISSWLAIFASFLYLKFYITSKVNGFTPNSKWLILSIIIALLSGYAHPIGIQLYIIGMTFFIFLIIFEKKEIFRNFIILLFIYILFITYDILVIESLSLNSGKYLDVSKMINFNLFERFVWMVNGGGYDTSMLFPERISVIEPFILNFLGLLPIICLILGIVLLIINKRRKEKINISNFFTIYLLIIICSGILLSPTGIGFLSMPHVRLYATATPLLLGTIFNILNLIKIRKSLPIIIGPILTILILLSFLPVYSTAQTIIPFSDNVTINLQQKITQLRDSLPEDEKNLPIIITYDPSQMGEKYFEYRLVPVIMMNNKNLYNNNIIIVSEWAATGFEGKFTWINFDYLRSKRVINVHWITQDYPNINLIVIPSYPKVSPKELKTNLLVSIENPQGMEGSPNSEFNWLGKTMEVYLYWQGKEDQKIMLSYHSKPGLGDPSRKRIVNVSMIKGKMQPRHIVETNGDEIVSIPLIVQPGVNIVEFRTIYPKNASVILPNDPREFLVYISQMEIRNLNEPNSTER